MGSVLVVAATSWWGAAYLVCAGSELSCVRVHARPDHTLGFAWTKSCRERPSKGCFPPGGGG